MTLDELITEGEEVRKECVFTTTVTQEEFLEGEEYEKWIAKATLFMEKNYPNTVLLPRFVEASKTAAVNNKRYYDTMMGIVKALKESA